MLPGGMGQMARNISPDEAEKSFSLTEAIPVLDDHERTAQS